MEGLKFYARLLWRPPRETLLFALRTVAAGLLTLYLAFLFDLEQPKWALMTVVIVSQPLAGMALKRSFAQVLGTFAGAVVAVLIMALFARNRCRSSSPWDSGWRSAPPAAPCCATPTRTPSCSAASPR